MRGHQFKKSLFTLVEILAVMAIIAVLLAMTTPAFSKLVRGSSVEIAARMVSSQLAQARAEAIAQRRYIAIYFPDNDFTTPTGDTTSTYQYSSFRPAYVTIDGSNVTFVDWTPGSTWSFLPQGAVLRAIETTTHEALKADCSAPSGDNPSDTNVVPINGGMRSIIFCPNGQAYNASYNLTFQEAIWDAADKKFIRENSSNVIVQHVNRYTGSVRYLYNGKSKD